MKYLFLLFTLTTLFLYSCKSNKKDKLTIAREKVLDDKIAESKGLLASLSIEDTNTANPVTDSKVALGHMLYFDTRLSKTGNNSCNSCHNLATHGVDNQPFSTGDHGEKGGRNSPTVLNAALHATQFWDGRAGTIEEQAGMPILNPVEMDIPDEAFLIQRLTEIAEYKHLFALAFPTETNPITYSNLRKAIGAFERKLITPSRYDNYLGGDLGALNLQEKRGLATFIEVGCTSCHNGPTLGGNSFQKFGVYGNYWDATKSAKVDNGRFDVTKNENDKYMFKVPGLRNIEHTHPYFHDGSIKDLKAAIKIMAKLQLNNDLSTEEIDDIAAFLKSLSADIPAEYKTAPKVSK